MVLQICLINLQGERERNQKAIADLEAERVNQQQTNERELTEAQAKLSEQQLQAQQHEAQLADLKVTFAFTLLGDY